MESDTKAREEKSQNTKNKYEELIEEHLTKIDEQEMELSSVKKRLLEQNENS
jgi:ferric iron reductase protein FhuF